MASQAADILSQAASNGSDTKVANTILVHANYNNNSHSNNDDSAFSQQASPLADTNERIALAVAVPDGTIRTNLTQIQPGEFTHK